MSLSDSLLDTLRKLPQPKGYLLAFSGGVDSHVLLHLMNSLIESTGQPLRALHIDHQLHPDAEQWSSHCAAVCADLGIAYQTVSLSGQPLAGESVEAWARNARYRCLAEHLGEGEMLLTAQHQDDQAETLLLQLLRGAGLPGLAAMPLCRRWQSGWQARPLLQVSRQQILVYAREHSLRWLEDPSNRDTRFDRNFLRQQVIPLLQQRWPACGKTLARSAGHLAEAQQQLLATVPHAQHAADQGRTFDLALISALGPTETTALLRAWITGQGVPAPSSAVMQQLLGQLASERPDAGLEVRWGPHGLRRYRGRLHLGPAKLPEPPDQRQAWKGDFMELPGGAGELSTVEDSNGVPASWFEQGRVSVRWARAQDRFVLRAREGTRSFRKICQELGIPTWERAYLPLICVDDEVVSLAGLAWCGEPFDDSNGPLLKPVWSGPAFA